MYLQHICGLSEEEGEGARLGQCPAVGMCSQGGLGLLLHCPRRLGVDASSGAGGLADEALSEEGEELRGVSRERRRYGMVLWDHEREKSPGEGKRGQEGVRAGEEG